MTRLRRSAGAVAVLTALAVGVAACGDDNDASANRRDVYQHLADDVVVPAYDRLAKATATLATATDEMCAAPDDETVDAARAAWVDAWSAWNSTKAFRFGPLTDARTVPDIGFMIDPEKIDAVLGGSQPAAGPPFTVESVAATGTDVRGLAAVEHLLFEQDPAEANTCAYAAAASTLVAEKTDEARVAWAEGSGGDDAFATVVAEPGTTRYADSQAVLDDFVNGMAMGLTETTKELADAEAAPPGERDTVGGHGGDRVRDAVTGIRETYTGTAGGKDGPGIGALMAAASSDGDDRVRTLLERATKAVDALPPDLNDASRAQIDDAYLRVRSLGTIIRAEVASILGVTLSLSDSDGDS